MPLASAAMANGSPSAGLNDQPICAVPGAAITESDPTATRSFHGKTPSGMEIRKPTTDPIKPHDNPITPLLQTLAPPITASVTAATIQWGAPGKLPASGSSR